MKMYFKTLKPIDLFTISGAVTTAYFFREAMVMDMLGWQVVVLGIFGFALGLFYHFQGNALGTSNRTQMVFLLSYLAMIVPAVIAVDGWTILSAWFVYGPMAVPFAVTVYLGWGTPMLFGREAPQR